VGDAAAIDVHRALVERALRVVLESSHREDRHQQQVVAREPLGPPVSDGLAPVLQEQPVDVGQRGRVGLAADPAGGCRRAEQRQEHLSSLVQADRGGREAHVRAVGGERCGGRLGRFQHVGAHRALVVVNQHSDPPGGHGGRRQGERPPIRLARGSAGDDVEHELEVGDRTRQRPEHVQIG
jgi:hypothetical protein